MPYKNKDAVLTTFESVSKGANTNTRPSSHY